MIVNGMFIHMCCVCKLLTSMQQVERGKKRKYSIYLKMTAQSIKYRALVAHTRNSRRTIDQKAQFGILKWYVRDANWITRCQNFSREKLQFCRRASASRLSKSNTEKAAEKRTARWLGLIRRRKDRCLPPKDYRTETGNHRFWRVQLQDSGHRKFVHHTTQAVDHCCKIIDALYLLKIRFCRGDVGVLHDLLNHSHT